MTAQVRDVVVFAASLPQSFLECRELGHSWRPSTATWDAAARCYDRTLKCARCKTLRVETLSPTGALLGRKYDYPDGYESEDLGRITGDGRNALRRESLTRAIGGSALRRIS